MKPISKNGSNAGFTLVELSIVMTIIALLVGGVLKGQEMVNNARVTQVITDVQSYEAAHVGFMDKYSQIPGDMTTAQERLKGCTAAASCLNGNGDNKVGRPDSSAVGIYTTMTLLQNDFATRPESETLNYWKHLSIANFTTGIDPTSANPSIGAKPLTGWGEFDIFYYALPADPGGTQSRSSGHYLRLHKPNSSTNRAAQAVPVKYAFQIDQKIDDGGPVTGNIRSLGMTPYGRRACNKFFLPQGDGNYDISYTGESCIVFFKLSR